MTIFSASAIFFMACQKELSLPEGPVLPPDPTPVTIDSTDYLEKIFSIDSLSGISDTTQIVDFVYDASKRVTARIIYVHNILASTYTYSYNGNDTLPYKTQQVDFENGMPLTQRNDTTRTFYLYTSDGRNLYDSSFYSVHNMNNGQPYYQLQKITNRYEYASGRIFRLSSRQVLEGTVPVSATPSYSVDTAEVDAGRNITGYKHYSILPSGASQFTNLYTYTYDNKPSPFAKLSNFKTLDPMASGSQNNKLKIHYEFQGGTLDEDLSGRYLYKTNGYPYRLAFPSGTNYYHIESYIYKTL
ncbi:hypothetical protein [Ferruginibacter sp. HRS2-29]|uniref:hypothetical protein n=1 Tax=Ferruginibacter sp. HRS2-29 TaxID=2487334 RepID=UPI0020CBBEAA|nr:hypothetical protein [Ferruginibacter sp. HRS2-29]MCP9750252.1 hypothetical protein [Ferruginibacter sp. HRS2-29]